MAYLPAPPQQPLDQEINVVAFDERHLDVDLGELELAIGPLVLVAKATGELIIPLDAADHQDLVELLRGLRQGVKRSRIAAIRNQEFAGACGRGFEQNR